MAQEPTAKEHSHDAIVHSHVHYHVTHNFRELTGGFEHLSSEHEHDHDHAPLTHSHHPHEDFESEHLGEAHIHDHVQPARDLEGSNGKRTTAKRSKAASAAT